MSRQRYSDDLKMQAMADLAAGATVKEVASRYNIPFGTVAHWAPSSKRGSMKLSKIANLHDLEAAFRRQLALNFAAQEAIMGQVLDAEWLSQQSAADLVSLFSTMFRTGGKLLGALYGPAAGTALDNPAPDPEDPAP